MSPAFDGESGRARVEDRQARRTHICWILEPTHAASHTFQLVPAMTTQVAPASLDLTSEIVLAEGEAPAFHAGEAVRVMTRSPIGHYRVPLYLRGRSGVVVTVIEPMAVDNEEEAYGRNAGSKGHYYRVSFPLRHVWSDYEGSRSDVLLIEVYQTWLERA